jgi:hypothetical protein
MKKFMLPLLFLLLSSTVSHSQDSVVTRSKNRYANIDFGVGFLSTDLRNVNNFLSSYGYRPVSEHLATLSFSPSFFVNRFVLRGEYTQQLRTTIQQSDNSEATFTGRHVAVAIGYVVLQKPGFRIYPYVGLNSFRSQLTVRERTKAATLDALVNNQQRTFHLAYANASLDVGIQFDKMIGLKNRSWDCPQNARFMTMGVRAGYLIGPGEVKGRFNGTTIEDAPSYSPNGPYVKLVIGFSTKMRDLKWRK